MADTETLEQIAMLLPHPRREQFLAMVTQFKSVPDDDEYLQILNGIGFMTLIWKEIPNEIQSILENSNPITDTCHSVGKQVREAVIEAIPSYEDLKLICKRLEEHEMSLKRSASNRIPTPVGTRFPISLAIALGVLAGWFANRLLPAFTP